MLWNMLDGDRIGLSVASGPFEVGDLRAPDLGGAIHIRDRDRRVLDLLDDLDKMLKRWVS